MLVATLIRGVRGHERLGGIQVTRIGKSRYTPQFEVRISIAVFVDRLLDHDGDCFPTKHHCVAFPKRDTKIAVISVLEVAA